MITVYHLQNSRSQRMLWLLEELGLDYTIERFPREGGTSRAPEAYRKLHPLGKAPVIRDGDLVLAESGAIVEHLIERYGNGRLAPPIGDPKRARYLYWFHFAEGSAMAWMVTLIVLGLGGDTTAPLVELLHPELDRYLDFTQSELGAGPWLVGDEFTAADVMMGYVIEVAEERGYLGDRPGLRDYLTRIRERPGYRRALEKA